jgi:hypothetical protein
VAGEDGAELYEIDRKVNCHIFKLYIFYYY